MYNNELPVKRNRTQLATNLEKINVSHRRIIYYKLEQDYLLLNYLLRSFRIG